MKFTIPQKLLSHALKKGTMGSLIENTQLDNESFNLIHGSSKLKVEKNKLIISSYGFLSSYYEIEDNDIKILEEGVVLVPALDLLKWADQQKDSEISINYKPLDVPEIIQTGDIEEGDAGHGIKKIGNLLLVSKNKKRSTSKWSLSCFDCSHKKDFDFSSLPEKLFDSNLTSLANAVSSVIGSSLAKDYQGIYDSISVQYINSDLYFGCTDMSKCSIYKIDSENLNTKILQENKILLNGKVISNILKNLDPTSEISLYYKVENSVGKLYIIQSNFKIAISTIEVSNFDKFPDLSILLKKKYVNLCDVEKQSLVSKLNVSKIVNPESALFTFGNGKLEVYVASEQGASPQKSDVFLEKTYINEPKKIVLCINHLIDFCKTVKDDVMTLKIPEGENINSIQVQSNDDKSLIFYQMTISNPLYNKKLNN
jgi:hypothetical protein